MIEARRSRVLRDKARQPSQRERERRRRETCLPGHAALGRQQKMCRTVTVVERYHWIKRVCWLAGSGLLP